MSIVQSWIPHYKFVGVFCISVENQYLHQRNSVIPQRQRSYALAAGRINGVAQRRKNGRLAGLADAAPESTVGRQHDFHLGHLVHEKHRVVMEIGLLDAPVFDGDLTARRRSEREGN